MSQLTVIQNGISRTIDFTENPVLSEVLESAGYFIPHPCGKRGLCAKCKVLVDGKPELSCLYRLKSNENSTVELPDTDDLKQIAISGTGTITFDAPMQGTIGMVIDIGTTTVAMRTYNLTTHRIIYETGFINPQNDIAADVIGRIEASVNGKLQLLEQLICQSIEETLEKNKITPDVMVITGNTTMLYLLNGMNPISLSHAPFEADCLFDVNINFKSAVAYLPPCMHAFVGADITTAVMASGMCESDDISLLCDIGTNGEIALWKNKTLYVSSTAAGPAFEGANISCGCSSISGAIDKAEVSDGKLKIHTIDNAKPIGICGSGLIDLIASYLDMGIIRETGATDNDRLEPAENVFITQKDISQIQLAKSAVVSGIATMLKETGISPDEVKKIYIAGGFGMHINIKSAVRIGLIPAEFEDRIIILGNAALTGACQILGDVNKIDTVRKIASTSLHINLSGNRLFNNLYSENVLFP